MIIFMSCPNFSQPRIFLICHYEMFWQFIIEDNTKLLTFKELFPQKEMYFRLQTLDSIIPTNMHIFLLRFVWFIMIFYFTQVKCILTEHQVVVIFEHCELMCNILCFSFVEKCILQIQILCANAYTTLASSMLFTKMLLHAWLHSVFLWMAQRS